MTSFKNSVVCKLICPLFFSLTGQVKGFVIYYMAWVAGLQVPASTLCRLINLMPPMHQSMRMATEYKDKDDSVRGDKTF